MCFSAEVSYAAAAVLLPLGTVSNYKAIKPTGGIDAFDLIVSRDFTYIFDVTAVILPLLIASKREVKIFGVLVGMILWVVKREAAKAVDGATAAYAKSRISDEAYHNACPQSCSGGYLDASRQV